MLKVLFPKDLWTRRFTIMWIASFILVIIFDVLWSMQTTFRSMSFFQTYLSAILLSFLMSLPTALCPNKLWIQTVLMVVFAALFESNLLYFRTYFTAIPASSYLLVGNLHDFTASIVDSIRVGDICLLVPIFFGIYFSGKQEVKNVSFKKFSVSALVLILFSYISTIQYGGMIMHINKLSQECYYINTPIVIYSPFGKIISDLSQQQEELSPQDYNRVVSFLNKHNDYSNYAGITSNTPDNVIVIFLESFESWVIGAKCDEKELTPTLNSIVSDSTTLYFPNVATQVGTGRSIDAQLLMLSGLYPMKNEVYSMKYFNNTYYTIPKALKETNANLKTYLLTGDKAHVWNQYLIAKAFGIDTVLDANSWEITEKIGSPAKLSDNALFSQAIEKMKNGEIWEQGTNAYIHFIAYSSHNPFIIPQKYRKETFNFGDEKLSNYATTVNYVDYSLSKLLSYLKTRDDYRSTMVVIAGDHEGIETYRKDWKNSFNAVSEGQFTPLIILNSPISGRYDGIIGQVDVYSTLLDLMGLQNYIWQGLGYSAFNNYPNAAINAQNKIISNIKVSDSIINKLKTAQKVSDTIIKFDLLKDNSPSK